MIKNIFIYGLLAGAIVVSLGNLVFEVFQLDSFEYGELLGYSTMLVALTMVYFGIRRQRDHLENGEISFGKGLQVGLGITLVASAIYIAAWMISYHYGDGAELMISYFEGEISNIQNDASLTEVEKTVKLDELHQLRIDYERPLVMAGFTFIEIFPVGLLVSLLSAFLLKTKPDDAQVETA